MDREDAFAQSLAYLESQLLLKGHPTHIETPHRLAVAMSRETGSGAIRIAEKLAEYIQARQPPNGQPWTVLDKELVNKVLEDHHLPARLAKFLPEDKVSSISDTVDEILGLHPPSWLFVRQSTETILRLAKLGNVILVGRGANVITRSLPNVFRVRLVGSLEKRVARLQEAEHLNRSGALAYIRRNDNARTRYVKKYLHQDIADVLLYDLIINTDNFPDEEVARLIGDAVLRRIESIAKEKPRKAA